MPRAIQTAIWFRRAQWMLGECRRRYGDTFRLDIAYEGTWILLSDPADVRRVFTGDPKVLHAGEANGILRPVLGDLSVLLLDDTAHMEQRKLMLPSFHGERMKRYGDLMAEIAAAEIERWPRAEPYRVRPRMQAMTLEIILRAVFGVGEGDRLEQLRHQLRSLLDMITDPRRAMFLIVLGPERPEGALRGRWLHAPRRGQGRALHLPRPPARRRLPRAGAVPPRAVPGAAARHLHVDPVRRRRQAVPRRGVRAVRDGGGAARAGLPDEDQSGPPALRAGLPAGDHRDAPARRRGGGRLSPAARTRGQRRAATRDSLLRSAANLFSRHGLEGASVDRVAQEAGYTKGAFYANFKSKEELFLVMLDERFAAQIERLDRMLAGEREPGEEARGAAQDFIGFVHSEPEWPKLYFEFAAYAARNEDFRRELVGRQRALRERIVEIYRRWSADFPADPPLPLADIAVMTFAMADGFLLDQLIDPELDDELYANMLAVFFRGLQAIAVGWEPPPVE